MLSERHRPKEIFVQLWQIELLMVGAARPRIMPSTMPTHRLRFFLQRLLFTACKSEKLLWSILASPRFSP
jgi:hypothetical protein